MSSTAEGHAAVFALADGLRVGISPEEPAGVICTRSAGALEFEASLQWPESEAVPLFAGGVSCGESVKADFEEIVADGCNRIRGTIFSPYEEELRAALDGILRDLACTAAVREAALTSRVLRSRRPLCASPSAVESLARSLWEAGLRVGFGVSYLPAPEGTEVTVGCRGAEEHLASLLSERVERRGVAG